MPSQLLKHALVAFGVALITPLLLVANESSLDAYPIPLMANVGWGQSKGLGKTKSGKHTNVPVKPFIIPAKGETTLRLIGPRNGVANGQILLKAAGDPTTTQVTIGDLKSDGAVFQSDKVEIRYAQYVYRATKYVHGIYQWRNKLGTPSNGSFEPLSEKTYKNLWTLDPLMREETCKIEPGRPRSAWITCHIPKDAKPGNYKGTAKVKGGPNIPVELIITNAILPDLEKSIMSNNVRPKWELLASGNGIPLEECWKSERFWKMVRAYLTVMGPIRQQVCSVGVVQHSYVSSTGMVKWMRDGDKWSWDFSAMEKFVKVWQEVLGTPRIIEASALRKNWNVVSLRINYIDKKTGKVCSEDLPGTDPKTTQLAVQFTRELIKSLAKLGLDKKLALGIWHDKMRHGIILTTLLKEIPELRIAGWSHGNRLGGKTLMPRLALLTCKPNSTRKSYPYMLLGSMRAQRHMNGIDYQNVGIANRLWRVAMHDYNGVGFLDLARWITPGKTRRDPSYSYYTRAPFFAGLTMMVYPMRGGRVVTGIRYEVFRELCQDFELLKQLRTQAGGAALKTEMTAWLKARSATETAEGKPYTLELMAGYDEKHRQIQTASGTALTASK